MNFKLKNNKALIYYDKHISKLFIQTLLSLEKIDNSSLEELPQFLPGISYNEEKSIVSFYTNNLTDLKTYLEINEEININNLIYCLINQIKIMEEKNITLYSISTKDILVIEKFGQLFFFIYNSNKMKKINNNCIYFNEPFKFDDYDFVQPELKKISSLPASLYKNSIYYSIGLLIYSIVFNCQLSWCNTTNEYYNNDISVINDLNKIKGTKIYYLLQRCFTFEQDKRSLIFI